MKFGTCSDCNKYKFLATGTMCQSCNSTTQSEETWAVVAHIPMVRGGTRIYKDKMTESDAKQLASGHRQLTATPREEL